jgi:uncharacterized membrane protein
MSQTNKSATSTGLEPNVAGLLCYLLGWITGIIFLVIEKNNRDIRFHAIQSILVFGAITIVDIVIGWIPILGWIVLSVLGVVAFILWIVLMYKAYKGEKWLVPIAGKIAEKYAQPNT